MAVLPRIRVSLADHELNGVRIEAPITDARIFGPADRVIGSRSAPDLLYYSLGLHVESFERVIVGFRLVMDPGSRPLRWERRFRPATVVLIAKDGDS